MPIKEKAHQSGGPIPNTVLADGSDSKISQSENQADLARTLARSVFGRGYIVVHEPIGSRFRTRAPSHIRSWRAPR
jgi:hypothetical protein